MATSRMSRSAETLSEKKMFYFGQAVSQDLRQTPGLFVTRGKLKVSVMWLLPLSLSSKQEMFSRRVKDQDKRQTPKYICVCHVLWM